MVRFIHERGERMIHYKKINPDGTLNLIGTQDTLPTDAEEITETEYTELYQYIQDNAVHVIAEEETTE